MKKLLFLSAFVALALISGQAQVYNLGSSSAFDSLQGDVDSPVTDAACGVNFLDNSTGDKPEGRFEFPAITNGFQLDFTVTIDNTGLTTLPAGDDIDIQIRMGNPGQNPTSGSRTGFGIVFRHYDDSTNGIRATNAGDSTTSSGLGSFQNIADGTAYQITIIGNNNQTMAMTDCNGNALPVNTYNLYIDGVFIQQYTLAAAGDNSGFDPTLGFGYLNVHGGSDGRAGAQACFANLMLSVGIDNPAATCPGIPTVGEWGLIVLTLALSSIGLIAVRENKEEGFVVYE